MALPKAERTLLRYITLFITFIFQGMTGLKKNLLRLFSMAMLGLFISTTGFNMPAHADDDDATDQQALVDRAAITVQDFFGSSKSADKNAIKEMRSYLRKSKAVMICPSVVRISLIFGGSDGGCLLLSRDARGSWSDPAFYNMGGGSFGLQLGVDNSEAIFFIMSRKALRDLMDNQFKMDANASASLASMGGSTQTGSDIIARQKAKGLFAGVSFQGAKLGVDSEANHTYYHQPVGPEDILLTMRVNNTGADPLRSVLTKYGSPAESTTSTAKTTKKTKTKTSGESEVSSDSSSSETSPYPDDYDSSKSYDQQVKSESLNAPTKSKSSTKKKKKPTPLTP